MRMVGRDPRALERSMRFSHHLRIPGDSRSTTQPGQGGKSTGSTKAPTVPYTPGLRANGPGQGRKNQPERAPNTPCHRDQGQGRPVSAGTATSWPPNNAHPKWGEQRSRPLPQGCTPCASSRPSQAHHADIQARDGVPKPPPSRAPTGPDQGRAPVASWPDTPPKPIHHASPRSRQPRPHQAPTSR